MKIKLSNIKYFFFGLFLACIPIVPDYFVVGGYAVALYLVVFGVLLVLIKGMSKRRLSFFIKYMGLPLLLLIISRGVFREWTSLINYFLINFMLAFVVFMYVTNKYIYNYAQEIIAVIGIIMFGWALVERITGFNCFSLVETIDLGTMGATTMLRNGSIRVQQSFGQPLPCALYYMFIAISSFVQYKQSHKRIFAFSAACAVLGIMLTGSRMPLVTMMIILLIYMIDMKANKVLLCMIGLLIVVFADIANGGVIVSLLSNYISLFTNLLSGTTEDVTTMYRLGLIPILIPYIIKKPILGYGVNYMSNFSFYLVGGTHTSIDNAYLSNMIYHGLLGTAAVFLPILYLIWISKSIQKKYCFEFKYMKWLGIIYMINLASVAQLSEKRIFIVIMALVMAYYYNSQAEESASRA